MSNIELAKGASLDPSLISRYLSGTRKLKAASPQLDAIAEFILSYGKRMQDIEWLKEQFLSDGLPNDLSTVYRIKQNLVLWLAADGASLRRSLGGAAAAVSAKPVKKAAQTVFSEGCGVKRGYLELLLGLEPILAALQPGAQVDVFLSSDRIRTISDPEVSALILKMVLGSNLHIRMVVCVSGDTQAMSRILDAYIEPLVSGHVQLLVVHGLTQTVTNQLHMIFPDGNAVLVTETLESGAAPVSVFLTDPDSPSQS